MTKESEGETADESDEETELAEEEETDESDEEAESDEAEMLKTYAKVAKIGREVKAYAKELAAKEKSLLKLGESIEKKILELGGHIAFPANLSRNDEAAHYTPEANDASLIGEKDVLKIDLGVHIDGLTVDFAFTRDYSGENGKLVEATEEALQNALSIMKAGRKTSEVGKEIEQTIRGKGFKPVENLCGHLMEPYDLHAGIEVPNVERGSHVFEEGEVFAIEPFASTGNGMIREGTYLQIYMVKPNSRAQVRLPRSRELLAKIVADRMTLPFALRWYAGLPMLNLSINDLVKNGVLEEFPVLVETKKGSLISQAESTVRIQKDGVELLV